MSKSRKNFWVKVSVSISNYLYFFFLDKVTSIAAGDGVSLFLNETGNLYTCGHRKRNGLPGDKHANVPTLVPSLKDSSIKFIGAGFTHCGSIDKDGKLYTWGSGEFYQLGHGNKEHQQQPKLVKSLQEVVVMQFSATRGEKNCHSGCIDSEGRAYTWGSGIAI